MKFKSSLIIFGMLIMLSTAVAQNIRISGIVIDSLSKQGLPNATVTLIKKNNDKNISSVSITNDKGAFYNKVLSSGQYFKIEVDYLGYKKYLKDSIWLDEQHLSIPPIKLIIDQKNLKTVTVNVKKPFIVVASDKITLNVSESPITSNGNAYDVLLRGPGITEQNNVLSFRGKSIRVLINGRPSNLSGEELKNMLTGMLANSIERVEILVIPSAKYDAEGGSIINIVLVKNKNFGTNYTFTSGMGAGRFFRCNEGLDVNYRNKDINIYGSYNYMHNEQYFNNNSERFLSDANVNQTEYDVRNRNNHSIKFGIDYDLNKKSTLGFFVNGYHNYRGRDVNNISSLQYSGNPYDSTSHVNTSGNAVFSSPSINVFYKTILDSTGNELSINADYFNYTKQWSDYFATTYLDYLGNEYLLPTYLKDNSPSNNNVYSFTTDFIHPTKKAKWEAGFKTSYTVTDNNIDWQSNTAGSWIIDQSKTNHFVYKENINAVYVNYIRVIKKFNLQAGLRLEQTNTLGNSITLNQIDTKNYYNFFPNISLQYTKSLNHIFGISYRKSINRFGFDLVNPFIIYQNQFSYSQGNPNLNPQINHKVELSYTYKQFLVFGLSYSRSLNALGPVYLQGNNNITISSYDNFRKANQVYLYASYSKTLFKLWNLNLVAGAGHVEYDTATSNKTEKGQFGNAKWTGLLQNNNVFNFKKGWAAELTAYYMTAMASGIYTLNPMFSTSVGISKNIWKTKGNLKLSISDVLNTQEQVIDINYQGIMMHQNYKMESRYINLTFKYKFGNKNVKAKRERESKINDIKGRMNN